MAGKDDIAGSGSPVVKKQKKRIDIRQLFAERMELKPKELDIYASMSWSCKELKWSSRRLKMILKKERC